MLRGKAVYELDARYLIRAEDGALIDIVNRGYWRALTPEALARAEAGEELAESEVYFRTVAGLPHRRSGPSLAGRDRLRRVRPRRRRSSLHPLLRGALASVRSIASSESQLTL